MILIVEDDLTQLRAITRIFSYIDTQIHQAQSGQEALSLMLREDFKLVLLDINMPNMDGIETAKLMRKNKRTENIPIIFITAYDQDETSVQKGYQLGAIDYVFKPIIDEILLSKVKMFLRINEQEQLQKEKEKAIIDKYIGELEEKNKELKNSQLAALNIMEDANEAKELLLQKTNELESANTELNQFAFIASHDLQEPLRTVTNYIQLMREDHKEKFSEETINYFQKIEESTIRMKNMIKGVLNFSKLGRTHSIEKLHTKDIIDEVIEDIQNMISETKTQVNIRDLPIIYSDRTELRIVFQNLISNAIKFRKKNVLPIIEIGYTETSDFWEFYVSDNGIGIDKKGISKIFNIYQRLHSLKEYEGQGIGLASCKKIIESHNGKIWIDSTLKEGSIIYFTLPKLKKERHD